MVTEGIQNKIILIIDDDVRMLRALAKTLTSEGAVAIRAQGAGEAVEILSRREKTVELVITDLRMPLVDGASLLGFIRMIKPDLPVIILTAFGSPETRAECIRQGAAAFLEKNLSTAQLLTEIEKVFAEQKYDRLPSASEADETPQSELNQ